MTDIRRVLHITAHLGGGVGKALSGLMLQAAASHTGFRHSIVTLEEQERSQFMDLIIGSGCEVVVCPSPECLRRLIESSDIVQLEWWNHPATLQALCSQAPPPMRLLVWSHVSGLFNPIIPVGLLLAAHQFLFTSACSFAACSVKSLPVALSSRIGVVSSGGGFDEVSSFGTRPAAGLVAGYLGSLNFAKLHPHYVDFLLEVRLAGFRVRLIGEETNKEILEKQCLQAGRAGMLEFRGFTDNVAAELASLNVLVYLLNPEHYGTTENALIEAMAMGIVPVVLNNPAERHIVEHGRTGLIVSSPGEFAEAVHWLHENPEELRRMGREAAKSVRDRFSVGKNAGLLNSYYSAMMSLEKESISFVDIFGSDPADWFLSCQGYPEFFSDSGNGSAFANSYSSFGLLERTKGSVFHFLNYFPDDLRLNQWSKKLTSLL